MLNSIENFSFFHDPGTVLKLDTIVLADVFVYSSPSYYISTFEPQWFGIYRSGEWFTNYTPIQEFRGCSRSKEQTFFARSILTHSIIYIFMNHVMRCLSFTGYLQLTIIIHKTGSDTIRDPTSPLSVPTTRTPRMYFVPLSLYLFYLRLILFTISYLFISLYYLLLRRDSSTVNLTLNSLVVPVSQGSSLFLFTFEGHCVFFFSNDTGF